MKLNVALKSLGSAFGLASSNVASVIGGKARCAFPTIFAWAIVVSTRVVAVRGVPDMSFRGSSISIIAATLEYSRARRRVTAFDRNAARKLS